MNPHQNAACASIAGGLQAARTLGFDHGNVDTHFSTIQSEFGRRGILQMTAAKYFDLVDKSGRMALLGKWGSIDADLARSCCVAAPTRGQQTLGHGHYGRIRPWVRNVQTSCTLHHRNAI
jgi:hypothetical protein